MTTFTELVALIHSAKDKKQLEDFLLGLTTPHERSVLARRIEIFKLLLAGQPQHEIAGNLQVGVSTVTRWSKELSAGHRKLLKSKLQAPKR